MTRSRLPQNQKRPRLRKLRLFLESLEDRTLLSNGLWLVDITGLPTGTSMAQAAAAQQLFQKDGVDPNLSVVENLGAPGITLVQAPTSYTQQQVYQALSSKLSTSSTASSFYGVKDVEAFDPNKDSYAYNIVFPRSPSQEGDPASNPPGGGSSTPPGPFTAPGGGGSGGPMGPGGPDVGSITGFKGIDSPHSDCGCSPPDSDGAVGPSSFVDHTNTSIALFDKSGNLLPGTSITSDATFYASILHGGDSFSDPLTVYDEFTGKFVTTELEFNESSTMFLDVATSKTSNPLSLTSADWTFAQYNTNDGTGGYDFSDYPKVGYNADGLVYSFNMFPNLRNFDHVSTLSIRNDGSSPGIHITPGGNSNFTLAPATMHTSISGDPMWFVQDGNGSGGGSTVTVVREDNPFSGQSFSFMPIGVNPYGNAPNPRQPGGSLGSRTSLGTRFYFSDLRNVSGVTHLVSADAVGANGGAQARWYDFTISGGVPSLFQQGAIDQGAGVDTYFPAIAIDPNGGYGLNFSESSNTEFMSMYVTGRLATDPLGTMQTPILVKAGTGFLNAFGRAGDYSATTVDPTDGTFWAINEWSDGSLGSPNWSTWIDHFNLSGVSPPPPPSPGAITGRVFNDPLHNGTDDPSDPGLPGWLVYIDVAHTGKFNPSDPYQITDATGSYKFSSLTPGTYHIGEVLLPTYVESTPVSLFGEQTVVVPSGTTVTKVDFGDYQTSAQVLVDDADPNNFQTTGGDWDPNGPAGFNGGSTTNPNLDATQNAQWTVATGKGRYELFATWANDASYDPNATYKIFDGTTSGTLLGTVTENQMNAAYQANINGGYWDKLGTFKTTTGKFTIELVTDGDGKTIDADAVFAAKAPLITKTLFYGGDFDPSNPNASGLANEVNTVVSQASTYQNFVVPVGETWTVTGLFSNDLVTSGTLFDSADWSIHTGVSSGNGGTVVASGNNFAVTVTPTGRSGFGLTEDHIAVNGLSITLGAGTYWMNVTPVDHGSGRSFNSNTFGKNQVGTDIPNDQFFDSSFFGAHFSNANNFGPFPDFSDGVIGVTNVSDLITNGGFEASGGSFAGWTHVNETGGSGDWFIQSGTTSPVSGFGVPLPPGPTHAAMTDTTGPGSHVLYQDVTIPTDVTGGSLSFQRFIGNRNGAFYTPASLDFNVFPNQQARVDIIKTSANVFSVAPSDVLMNIYQTQVGDPPISGYTPQTTNLSSFLTAHAGQTVRLRFAEADNQFYFQFGIDDVSLKVSEALVASHAANSVGTAGPASAAPSNVGGATNTSNTPTGVVRNASTLSSVSPIDNLFISMGNGAPINPAPAQLPPSNGNTTISGAAFNAYVTRLLSASSTDLVPGEGGDGNASSQDPLL